MNADIIISIPPFFKGLALSEVEWGGKEGFSKLTL
jgi:hypothetical protein